MWTTLTKITNDKMDYSKKNIPANSFMNDPKFLHDKLSTGSPALSLSPYLQTYNSSPLVQSKSFQLNSIRLNPLNNTKEKEYGYSKPSIFQRNLNDNQKKIPNNKNDSGDLSQKDAIFTSTYEPKIKTEHPTPLDEFYSLNNPSYYPSHTLTHQSTKPIKNEKQPKLNIMQGFIKSKRDKTIFKSANTQSLEPLHNIEEDSKIELINPMDKFHQPIMHYDLDSISDHNNAHDSCNTGYRGSGDDSGDKTNANVTPNDYLHPHIHTSGDIQPISKIQPYSTTQVNISPHHNIHIQPNAFTQSHAHMDFFTSIHSDIDDDGLIKEHSSNEEDNEYGGLLSYFKLNESDDGDNYEEDKVESRIQFYRKNLNHKKQQGNGILNCFGIDLKRVFRLNRKTKVKIPLSVEQINLFNDLSTAIDHHKSGSTKVKTLSHAPNSTTDSIVNTGTTQSQTLFYLLNGEDRNTALNIEVE